jgi:hypothetical protein
MQPATTPPQPPAPVSAKPLLDEVTQKPIVFERIVLKDERGDNHYFQNWQSVVLWAQSKIEKIA